MVCHPRPLSWVCQGGPLWSGEWAAWLQLISLAETVRDGLLDVR